MKISSSGPVLGLFLWDVGYRYPRPTLSPQPNRFTATCALIPVPVAAALLMFLL